MPDTQGDTTPSIEDLAQSQARIVVSLQAQMQEAADRRSIQVPDQMPVLASAIDKFATLVRLNDDA